MPAHIVVVEDDFLQEGPLQEHLQNTFPAARIETLSTESEFRERLAGLRDEKPDLVILDMMLRWTSPRPDLPEPPPDVVDGDYFRAGFRCAELMAKDDELNRVPVIIYTILERSDLERSGETMPLLGTYVRKSSDLHLLTKRIRDLVPSATLKG
jgi:DNA-binding NarL/FixJ family response regulator